MSRILRAGMTVVGLAIIAGNVAAQVVRPTRPTGAVRPPPRDTTRAPGNTTRPDSTRTKADSAKTRELIKWMDADSIANALMNKDGYSATRYQGVHVHFDAKSRTLYLEGEPAGVR